MNIKYIAEVLNWIHLAQDDVQWEHVIDMIISSHSMKFIEFVELLDYLISS
jgi:hypothetical protein